VNTPFRTTILTVCAIAGFTAVLAGCSTSAPSVPGDWDFPGAGVAPLATPNPATIVSLPGSIVHYTQAQIDSGFTAIDWFPLTHPSMPTIVRSGRPPKAFACGYCHLPDGVGRPENAALAGLSVSYITSQVHAMQTGTRKGANPQWLPIASMLATAHAITNADIASAADYFSKRPFIERTKVVEASNIPAVEADSFVYRQVLGNDQEALAARIIETPDDFKRFEIRDTTLGFTAYVPTGSLARGQVLATGNQGKIPACMVCHGTGLSGSAIAPPLAGRSATYLYRQLDAFRTGSRQSTPMQSEVANLSPGDLIDLAAYVASLKP
jgi:cytochrome c553